MTVVKDRFNIIERYVRGRKVLDLGCVGEHPKIEKDPFWLHARIKKVAKYVLGVDIKKDEVKRLRKLGYNIIAQDVENIDLNDKFDVIVAGELIEHLPNPGKFLERIKTFISQNGYIIITTPNAFSIREFIYNLIGKRTHQLHTHLYTKQTLEMMLKLHGYKIVESCFYLAPSMSKIRMNLLYLLCRIKNSLADRIIVVCKKEK